MNIRLEFKPEDFWIGAFWRSKDCGDSVRRFDLWVCLLPMLPIHFWRYTAAGAKGAR